MAIFIGDIHCERRGLDPDFFEAGAIQLGDLCLKPYHKWARYAAPRFFLEGNHDFYPQLQENKNQPYEVTRYGVKTNLYHIPRGFVDNNVLFVGGAYSIDNRLRIDGRDWFASREQLTYSQMNLISNILVPINVVVAHDCPSFVYKDIYRIQDLGGHSKSLQMIFEEFCPELWIYGHHHEHKIFRHNGCKFICVDICQKIDIPEVEVDLLSHASIP